ncbi:MULTISPECIES: hypothetical protein [Corynebacterium]|nr:MULTISPECIES: hypothetical protein [Corynebacterium]MDK7181326.1 hypothetical protein [Corynebacterium riegelii]QQU84436.1 hypothetical protein I6I71_02320 [Corynebacterium riegelii]
MDLAAILEPVLAFFREGVGKGIADILAALYDLFYPANAEPAHPVELPK